MDTRVSVLLLEVPKLLRDILEHAIRREGDYELIVDQLGALQGLAEQTISPDIVILGLSAAEDATLVPALFGRWPGAHVMTVAPSGGDAAVYELSPRREVFGEMSPAEILVTLRESVRRRRELARQSFIS